MKYLSIIVFIIVSIKHLKHSLESDIKGRKDTKPLIIPTLILLYLSMNIGIFNKDLLIGLLFGFFGDYLLMSSRKKYSSLGEVAFAIGHIFYIKAFVQISGGKLLIGINLVIIIIIYIIYALFFYEKILKKMIKEVKKIKIAGVIIYLIIISVMSILACLLFVSGVKGMMITYIGTILFIISDSCLIYRDNVKRSRYMNFIVMLTYIAAQLLIVSGFILNVA